MYLNTHRLNSPRAPLHAMLGLDCKSVKPMQRNKFFFASPLTSQRLIVLKQMVGGRSPVILVIGERGSGKTTLMNQFISDARNRWSVCRIRLKPKKASPKEPCQNLNNRLVFLTKKDSPPSVIIDDAHQLSGLELQLLMQSSFSSESTRKFQSIVLFAEPQMRNRLAEIAGWLPPKSVIDKIYMAPLTEKQTAAYLEHRVKVAGYCEKDLFSSDQIRTIHALSGGLPGWINGEAYMLLKRMKKHKPIMAKQKMTFINITHKLRDRLPRMFKR